MKEWLEVSGRAQTRQEILERVSEATRKYFRLAEYAEVEVVIDSVSYEEEPMNHAGDRIFVGFYFNARGRAKG